MPLIGYARVSTAEQDLALQRDALDAIGIVRVFEDSTPFHSHARSKIL